MRLSDLQSKDIVNINDGKKVGKIIDAEVTSEGIIDYFIIEEKKSLNIFISKDNDLTISFKQIKKIGTDVILVEL